MLQLIPWFIVLALLTGCSPATVDTVIENEGATPLGPAAILEVVEDNTLFLHSTEEDTYLFLHTSGRAFGKDIYGNRDIGKWDVSEDGQLCFRMNTWWYGDLRCFQTLMKGDRDRLYLANSAQVIDYRADFVQGDAQHLYQPIPQKRQSYRKSRQSAHHQSEEPKPVQPSAPASETTTDREYASARTATEAAQDNQATVQWMAKDCPRCNLAGADLAKADLVEARLNGANLSGANLHMANMRRANLEDADLRDAILTYANLPGANLKRADLRNADLQGANLIRADLTGADLRGVNLEGTLIEGATGLH